MTRKIVLSIIVLAMASLIILFQTTVGMGRAGKRSSDNAVSIDAVSGAKAIAEYNRRINGEDSRLSHFISNLSPREVLDEYLRGLSVSPRDVPVYYTGEDCAVCSFPYKGEYICVLAFGSASSKVTNYYVIKGDDSEDKGLPSRFRDCEGKDAFDVPRPPSSFRRFCITGNGDSKMLLMYESEDTDANIKEFYKNNMDTEWKYNKNFEKAYSKVKDSTCLYYAKGTRNCLINIADKGSKTFVTIVIF